MRVFFAAAVCFGVLFPMEELAARLPNILLIISDDQSWTDFGFMGHETIRTPSLDRLAAESVVFPRGYVPTSLCRPSLASMISGLFPHQHKITGNDPPRGTDRREMLRHIRRIPSLPRLLGKKGYLSHQSGKWWEGHYELGGFTHGMTTTGRHGGPGLTIGRKGLKPIFDFIDTAGDKPFFIWYAPFLPHTPHNPPARLLSKYKAEGKSIHVARYQAMCEWFDETCGELLGYLDKKKLSDDTLVVFVTDNGWIQKEKSRGSDARSKRSPFDGGTRTPVMLRWPGKLKAARHDTLVSSIDLAPTILAAAGLEARPEMQGVNLLDVCAAGGKSARNKIFGEIFEHDVGKIDDPVPGLLYRWCISGQWKLILPHRGSQVISRKRKSTYRDPIWAAPQLFNLGADPHERSNLAAAEADRVKTLGSDIESWWKVEKP